MIKNGWHEFLYKALGVIGVVFITFILGAVSYNYQLLPAKPVREAIATAEALYDQWAHPQIVNASSANKLGIKKVEQTIKNRKIFHNPEKSYDGYTLFTLRYSNSAYLVDVNGKMSYRWNIPFEEAFPNPTHVNNLAESKIYLTKAHIYPNGDLLAIYMSHGDTPYGYGMVKVDKHSKILWTYNGNTHHDFYVDKHNGNIYALTHYFIKDKHPIAEDLPYPMLVDFLEVLSPDGGLLEKISLLDLFAESPYKIMMYHNTVEFGRPWDIFHTNSIMKLEPEIASAFPMFKQGQLLLSVRNMDALAVVDLEQKKLVWAYNGIWRGQHSATFFPNGKIGVYDNKGHIENERMYSRVVEFDPATLGVSWFYAGKGRNRFYSPGYGRFELLPNGNWLVTASKETRIFQVTRDGEVVWNYSLPTLVIKGDISNWVVGLGFYEYGNLEFLSKK